MAEVEMNHQKFIPRCNKHESDLLPLFCRDCNCLLCSDCVTTDHVTHNFCKVSDVAGFHKNKLEEVLKNSDSMSMLEKMLQQFQEKQINLAKDTENLIFKISEREEEIIQRVKLWSKKLIGNVNTLRERRGMSLKHDENVINALLHFEELSTEMDTINIVGAYLHCEVERLLPSKMEFTEEGKESDEYKFESGFSGEDLDTSFGRLELHHEQESSSDAVIEDNKDVNVSDSEDESNFHECHENKESFVYQTCAKYCIDDIMVFHERKIFILSGGTLFHCETNLNDYNITQSYIIKKGVYRIAEISSTGDLLCLLNNKKEIHRLSNRNIFTKFIFTTAALETVCALNSGGYHTYACLMLRCQRYEYSTFQYDNYICLLNEYGVTLKKYPYLLGDSRYTTYTNWRLLSALDLNNYIILRERQTVEKIDTKSNKIKSTYSGAIGISPESQFSPLDMAIDDKENVLLVVRNDNAVHLLDKSLKFQRLILNEEDGLQLPLSITLDSSGYLWVGCLHGKIHVFNYQHLLRTERTGRYSYRSEAMWNPNLLPPCKSRNVTQTGCEII
ncbi:uncharacterized protein LOC144619775 [Crassostrea virginica]